MRKLYPAILCFALLFTNCKKDEKPDPVEDPNKNEMLGYITIPGRNTRLFVARGSKATQFTRTVKGNDTEIVITAWDSLRTVVLKLVNISSTGAYSFQHADATAYNGTLASYREGSQSNPALFYSTSTTNPDLLPFSSFELFSLTDSYIQGKMIVMLGDTGPFTTVGFDEIMFKGNFDK